MGFFGRIEAVKFVPYFKKKSKRPKHAKTVLIHYQHTCPLVRTRITQWTLYSCFLPLFRSVVSHITSDLLLRRHGFYGKIGNFFKRKTDVLRKSQDRFLDKNSPCAKVIYLIQQRLQEFAVTDFSQKLREIISQNNSK